MAQVIKVVFLETGETKEYYTAEFDWYVLADGSYESVYTDIVWCNSCGKITQGERVEPLGELDAALAEIAAASDPNTLKGQGYLKAYPNKKEREGQLASYQRMLSQRRRWLAERVSPAKCLTCGTTDLIFLRVPEGVDTPVGKIKSEHTRGFADLWHNPIRYFSPEGDRIEYTPPSKDAKVPERKWWQFWRR